METELEYSKRIRDANRNNAIFALKHNACRRDKKGRAYYCVPTSSRRSGKMLIPEKSIKSFLKKGDITQEDVDNIKLY